MSILIQTKTEVETQNEITVPSWWKEYSQYIFIKSEKEAVVVHHIPGGYSNISVSSPEAVFKTSPGAKECTEADFNNVLFCAYRKISDTCEGIMGLNSVAAEIYPLYEIAN